MFLSIGTSKSAKMKIGDNIKIKMLMLLLYHTSQVIGATVSVEMTNQTIPHNNATDTILIDGKTETVSTEMTSDDATLHVTEDNENATFTAVVTRSPLPRYKYNASTTPVFMAIYLAIGILGMIGNFIVSVVMLKYRRLREKLTNAFVVNQSLIDFVTACVLVITQVTDDISWAKNDLEAYLFCRMWLGKWVLWGLFVASTYNLLVLTMERYFAIVHSMIHIRFFTKTKARVMMVCVWLFGLSWNLYDLFSTNMKGNQCVVWSFWPSPLFQQVFGILVVCVQYFIPLFVLVFAYGRIIYILHRKASDGVGPKASDGSKTATSGTSDNRELRMIKARTNVIKTLVIVAMCFIVCWGPNQLLFFFHMVGVKVDYSSWYYHWSVMMTFLNCCVNPIVYTFKYEEFKQCLRRMLCGCCTEKSGGRSSNSENSYQTDTTRTSFTDMSKMPQ